MILMRQWRLVVLQVHLDLTDRKGSVVTDLVAHPDGDSHVVWSKRFPLEAFGLGSGSGPPQALRMPESLADDVKHTLATDFPDETVLWLALVPPYGYLGAVPWEESLISAIDLPVLRVPDRLPAAVDPGQLWTAVIAVNAPLGSEWAAPYINSFLDSVRDEVPASEVAVHVFADSGTVSQLRKPVGGRIAEQWVHVHDPAGAQAAWEDRTTREVHQFGDGRGGRAGSEPSPFEQLWGDWIVDGMDGTAVRALHVVLDGAFDGDRPMLALSKDPNTPVDRRRCGFVTADSVWRLADVIGTAAVSFGSPPGNSMDAAVRMVADTLGQQRPGPTLYSALMQDPDARELARAYGFLVAARGARKAPRHRSLFLYAQPEEVLGRSADDPPPVAMPEGYLVSQGTDLTDYYESAYTVPGWVATSERYIGTQLANLTQAAPVHGQGVESKIAYDRGAAEALTELHEIVAKHARPS